MTRRGEQDGRVPITLPPAIHQAVATLANYVANDGGHGALYQTRDPGNGSVATVIVLLDNPSTVDAIRALIMLAASSTQSGPVVTDA